MPCYLLALASLLCTPPHQAVARAKAVVRKAAIKVAQVKVVSMKRAAAKVARTLQADRRRDGSTRSLTVHAKKHYAIKGAKAADLWMQRQLAKRAKVRNLWELRDAIIMVVDQF